VSEENLKESLSVKSLFGGRRLEPMISLLIGFLPTYNLRKINLLITTVHGTSKTKIAPNIPVNYTSKSQKQENANEKVQQVLMQF
jgi:hypothetical protein